LRVLILILLTFTFFVENSKGADPLLAIKLNYDSPVQYCNTPVFVAGNLTIEGTFAITGMKISFSQGFVPGEDELVYSDAIATIKGDWAAQQGYLLLKPNGTSVPTREDYRDAIKSVTYKNNKPIPTLGIRKISITLDDADYFEGHFYQFVSKSEISWRTARDEAASTLYHGLLKGYLATITSEGESHFISQKAKGVGWIGASDEAKEGDWRWITGPEGLDEGGLGVLFYIKNSGPYLGRYSNWDAGEPNNSGNNEDYAHIFYHSSNPGAPLLWNDLPNENGNTEDGPPKGYLSNNHYIMSYFFLCGLSRHLRDFVFRVHAKTQCPQRRK